jgi:hypothetical protein
VTGGAQAGVAALGGSATRAWNKPRAGGRELGDERLDSRIAALVDDQDLAGGGVAGDK